MCVVFFFFYLEVPHSIVNQRASGSGKYKFIKLAEPPSLLFLLIPVPLAAATINSSLAHESLQNEGSSMGWFFSMSLTSFSARLL